MGSVRAVEDPQFARNPWPRAGGVEFANEP